MTENEIARIVIRCSLELHRQLGPGLLINFGGELLKGNIERLVNGLDESPP